MKLEFLQEKEDILDFVDFLYEGGFFFFRNIGTSKDVPMDRLIASETLGIDLLTNGRTYSIGKEGYSWKLEYLSCGRKSHPRYVDRSGRDVGMIICHSDEVGSKEAFDMIAKYIKCKYVHQRYHKIAKYRCYFGPAYLQLDDVYKSKPEPCYICPGFVYVSCSQKISDTVRNGLLKAMQNHPELGVTEVLQRRWCDQAEKTEFFVGFLFDRSQFDMCWLIQIAKELNFRESRLRAVQEKNYEMVTSVGGRRCCDPYEYEVQIFAEHEWKGFGVFHTPTAWTVT